MYIAKRSLPGKCVRVYIDFTTVDVKRADDKNVWALSSEWPLDINTDDQNVIIKKREHRSTIVEVDDSADNTPKPSPGYAYTLYVPKGTIVTFLRYNGTEYVPTRVVTLY